MARGKKTAKELTPEEKLAQALVPIEEQPYQIPENWCWTYMNRVAQWGSGGTPSRKNPEYYKGYIPWIKTGELNDGYVYDTEEKITDEAIACSSAKIFPANTIAIAMYGATIGKVGILGMEAATNQACACGICLEALAYKFLFYYARSQKGAFIGKAKGGAQPNISQEIIKTHFIPLPPLAEQQRIVDRIESIFKKLDEAKEKAQEVVDGFELRKSAILHKAFTGKLTEKWREEHGETMDAWRKNTIDDLFFHTTGKALKQDNKKGTLHKYITTSNVYWGMFDFSEVREMYFTDDELEKCTATKGDLLICNGGDVGRAAIWNYNYDICLQNHISKLRKKKDNVYIPFFYYYFLFCKIYGNISGTGIGIASLSAKTLLTMEVKLPPLQEQRVIADILSVILGKEQKNKEIAEDAIKCMDAMKKTVLARAFRGELGTNDPEEESAMELLKSVINL